VTQKNVSWSGRGTLKLSIPSTGRQLGLFGRGSLPFTNTVPEALPVLASFDRSRLNSAACSFYLVSNFLMIERRGTYHIRRPPELSPGPTSSSINITSPSVTQSIIFRRNLLLSNLISALIISSPLSRYEIYSPRTRSYLSHL
jgi:hypothetical protein